MLATPKLAALARLADRHGWRVVLDRRPPPVGARSDAAACSRTCRPGPAIELDRIHRFHQPWERAASIRLRAGDPDVLAVYERHGRLHDGTTVDMTTEILTAWRTRPRGQNASVAMLAVTTETVDRLNQLAQQARITQPANSTPVAIATDATAWSICVGDEIVTRTNDRTLRTDRGAMVRNRAGGPSPGSPAPGSPLHGTDGTVRLPGDYVARVGRARLRPHRARRPRRHRRPLACCWSTDRSTAAPCTSG